MIESYVCRDAILLAGKDASATFSSRNVKYLLEIGGISILERILEQIERSVIERAIIVGDPSVIKTFLEGKEKQYIVVDAEGSISSNLLRGLNQQQKLSNVSRTIFLATDLPFLTSKTIDWLASLGDRDSITTHIPIVSKSTLLQVSEYYQTYYWPNSPEPFKWGDGASINNESMGKSHSRFMG